MNNYRETCTVILQEVTTALHAVEPSQVDQFVDALLRATAGVCGWCGTLPAVNPGDGETTQPFRNRLPLSRCD